MTTTNTNTSMTLEDQIDMAIVTACNELIAAKSQTLQQRVSNSNERVNLRRHAEKQKRLLDQRLRTLRYQKDLTVHREICAQVFDKAGMVVPGLAAARQAQLCLHVQILTVLDNQLDMLALQNQEEILAMESAMNRIRDGIGEREVQLLNLIMLLKQQIDELREWMETPPPPRQKKPQQNAEPIEAEMSPSSQKDWPNKKHNNGLLQSINSVDTEATVLSTPPSSPIAPASDKTIQHADRRSSLGLRGSFLVPARPQYLIQTTTTSPRFQSSPQSSPTKSPQKNTTAFTTRSDMSGVVTPPPPPLETDDDDDFDNVDDFDLGEAMQPLPPSPNRNATIRPARVIMSMS